MGSPEVPMPQTPVPAPPPEPQQSAWDAIAEEAWPGGPSSSKPPPLRSRRQPFAGGRGDVRDPGDEDPATISQPIYVWNPGASTENLPAVPPGENHNQ